MERYYLLNNGKIIDKESFVLGKLIIKGETLFLIDLNEEREKLGHIEEKSNNLEELRDKAYKYILNDIEEEMYETCSRINDCSCCHLAIEELGTCKFDLVAFFNKRLEKNKIPTELISEIKKLSVLKRSEMRQKVVEYMKENL